MTRVTLLDQKSVHIDGYKSIISFDDLHISIKCHKKNLEINGENLRITSFNGIQMQISGCISEIKWSDS